MLAVFFSGHTIIASKGAARFSGRSAMLREIEKKMNFRLEQSREKLDLSRVMLDKGCFNDSVIYSYLSLFYSVRALLIKQNEDSDDYDTMLELLDRYYEPSGWSSLNIPGILKESKGFSEQAEKSSGIHVTKDDAERMHRNAERVLDEVLKKVPNSLQ